MPRYGSISDFTGNIKFLNEQSYNAEINESAAPEWVKVVGGSLFQAKVRQ